MNTFPSLGKILKENVFFYFVDMAKIQEHHFLVKISRTP